MKLGTNATKKFSLGWIEIEITKIRKFHSKSRLGNNFINAILPLCQILILPDHSINI